MNPQQRQQAWWRYGGLIALFVALLWWIGAVDEQMTTSLSVAPGSSSGEPAPWDSFMHSVGRHAGSNIGMLLIQMVIILLVVRAVGWLFTRLHHPTVIG